MVFFMAIFLFGTTALAQGPAPQERVQMIFVSEVAPDLKAQIQITAEPSQRMAAEENFKKACREAQTLLDGLEPEAREKTLPYLHGFLADTIAGNLTQTGFADLLLALGDVYVARGMDFNGPWKVPVTDPTTANAQHVFLYKVHNAAAATARLKEAAVDPAEEPAALLKAVTVFSEEGALEAQRLAASASALTIEKAKKFLKVAGVPRAVLIDSEGKFIQIPEK